MRAFLSPCLGHVWRRLGGSRKEWWFECAFCGETRTKRRGTDSRVIDALERRAELRALLDTMLRNPRSCSVISSQSRVAH